MAIQSSIAGSLTTPVTRNIWLIDDAAEPSPIFPFEAIYIHTHMQCTHFSIDNSIMTVISASAITNTYVYRFHIIRLCSRNKRVSFFRDTLIAFLARRFERNVRRHVASRICLKWHTSPLFFFLFVIFIFLRTENRDNASHTFVNEQQSEWVCFFLLHHSNNTIGTKNLHPLLFIRVTMHSDCVRSRCWQRLYPLAICEQQWHIEMQTAEPRRGKESARGKIRRKLRRQRATRISRFPQRQKIAIHSSSSSIFVTLIADLPAWHLCARISLYSMHFHFSFCLDAFVIPGSVEGKQKMDIFVWTNRRIGR